MKEKEWGPQDFQRIKVPMEETLIRQHEELSGLLSPQEKQDPRYTGVKRFFADVLGGQVGRDLNKILWYASNNMRGIDQLLTPEEKVAHPELSCDEDFILWLDLGVKVSDQSLLIGFRCSSPLADNPPKNDNPSLVTNMTGSGELKTTEVPFMAISNIYPPQRREIIKQIASNPEINSSELYRSLVGATNKLGEDLSNRINEIRTIKEG